VLKEKSHSSGYGDCKPFTYFRVIITQLMTQNLKPKPVIKLLFLAGAFFISSCVGTKNVTYFQNLSSANKSVMESVATFTEPVIQADDILAISINTIDPQSSAVVNQAASVVGSGLAANSPREQPISGYLVDKNGEVELSLIGMVK